MSAPALSNVTSFLAPSSSPAFFVAYRLLSPGVHNRTHIHPREEGAEDGEWAGGLGWGREVSKSKKKPNLIMNWIVYALHDD